LILLRASLLAIVAVAPSGRGLAQGSGSPAPPAPKSPLFREVAAESGLRLRNVCGNSEKRFILESLGAGAAFFDAEGDGDADLYVANGASFGEGGKIVPAPPGFFRNEGGRFVEATAEAGLERGGWWHGASAADWNGDGRPDLLVTAYGRAALYRAGGAGASPVRFEEVAEKARLVDEGWSTSAVFVDLDLDGDLDVYVAHYITFDPATAPVDCPWRGFKAFCGPEGLVPEADSVWRNEGDGTFRRVTREWGYDPGEAFYALGVVAADLDGDGDPEIYVANDSTRNLLFSNRGDGRAVDVAVIAGVAYGDEGQEQAGMGVDAGDVDGDGDLDLFVTNFEGDYYTLYRNDGEFFTDVSVPTGLERLTWNVLGWGTRFFDFDHDGDEDLLAANGHVYPLADRIEGLSYAEPNHLYRNDGGRFALAEAGPAWEELRPTRGAAVADVDEDGDLDVLFVNVDEEPTLLRNEATEGRAGVAFDLVGRRSNRPAHGARVSLVAEGVRALREVRPNTGYLSSHDPRVHFGLGGARVVDRLLVRWPSGLEQEFRGLEGSGTWRIVEGEAVARRRDTAR